MASLSNDEKLNLKTMVGEMGGGVNNTDHIRKIKHSIQLRDDIRKLDTIRKTYTELYTNDFNQYLNKCQSECSFLFNNYTDIFNRIIKDELDLEIMTKFLIVLKLIEDGKVDQHEGSAMVGKVLKELFLDSAIKTADNLDTKNNNNNTSVPIVNDSETKDISWKEYKRNTL
jgi:hypothetical protein